jgi:hypothetical protein
MNGPREFQNLYWAMDQSPQPNSNTYYYFGRCSLNCIHAFRTLLYKYMVCEHKSHGMSGYSSSLMLVSQWLWISNSYLGMRHIRKPDRGYMGGHDTTHQHWVEVSSGGAILGPGCRPTNIKGGGQKTRVERGNENTCGRGDNACRRSLWACTDLQGRGRQCESSSVQINTTNMPVSCYATSLHRLLLWYTPSSKLKHNNI